MFSLRLFKLTLKKYISCFAFAIIGAIVPFLIIGAIAFCVINSLKDAEPIVKGTVAVVSEDENTNYINFALKYAENLDSISETLNFKLMDYDEAFNKLEKNKIIAILYLPPDVIEGILYGQNIPATIYFSNETNLSSVFLSEITKAAASLLSGAQAGTYTTAEIYRSNGFDDQLYNAYNDVDKINYDLTLSREKVFKTVNITMDQSIQVKDTQKSILYFYTASGILVFLLILGAPFTKFLQKENDAFYSLLKTKKAGIIIYDLIIFFIYFINILIFETGFMFIISKISLFDYTFEINSPLLLVCNGFIIASFTFLLSRICSNTFIYIISTFLLGLLIPFISGLIIPMAFIPQKILEIGFKLPFYPVHNSIYELLAFGKTSYTYSCLIWGICFLITAFIINNIKLKRSRWILLDCFL